MLTKRLSLCALALVLLLGLGSSCAPRGDAGQELGVLEWEMAQGRLRRCSSLAGAMDTYAKALFYQKPAYLAAVTPLAEQAALEKRLREEGLAQLSSYATPETLHSYHFYNLHEEENGTFRTLLGYQSFAEEKVPTQEEIYLPLHLGREGDSWVLLSVGERRTEYPNDGTLAQQGTNKHLVPLERMELQFDGGSITLEERSVHITGAETAWNPEAAQSYETFAPFGPQFFLNPAPLPDAPFRYANLSVAIYFHVDEDIVQEAIQLGLEILPCDASGKPSEDFGFSPNMDSDLIVEGDLFGRMYKHIHRSSKHWFDLRGDDEIFLFGGATVPLDEAKPTELPFPAGYAIQIYRDGEPWQLLTILREVA